MKRFDDDSFILEPSWVEVEYDKAVAEIERLKGVMLDAIYLDNEEGRGMQSIYKEVRSWKDEE